MKKHISLFIISSVLIISCKTNPPKEISYMYNEGFVHGTTYHIKYQYNTDCHEEIEHKMALVNSSLSPFDSLSVITKVNNSDSLFVTDSLFLKVYNASMDISEKTNGAFDITVAPLVNAWGFGFGKSQRIDSLVIDSILSFVGFEKLSIKNNTIVKTDKRIKLDASAIAKGFSVDCVAELLEQKGIENYMVEIGGEVRAKGISNKGKTWVVGIDKPIDDSLANNRELESAISLTNMSVATSGNYRRFYLKDGIKYSHTIDPKSGYPVNHSLLSVSVFYKDCMTADAYATSFMVLGLEESIKIANITPDLDVYFIYATENGNYGIYVSENLKQYIVQLDN